MGVERVGRPTLWLSLSAQPVRDQAGEVDGVVLTFTDITSQREAERALRTSEQRIDEATEALQWQTFHDPRSEEHTSELQSLMRISYAVFCLKKKNKTHQNNTK